MSCFGKCLPQRRPTPVPWGAFLRVNLPRILSMRLCEPKTGGQIFRLTNIKFTLWILKNVDPEHAR